MLGGSDTLRLPQWTSDSYLMDYVPNVYQLLQEKVKPNHIQIYTLSVCTGELTCSKLCVQEGILCCSTKRNGTSSD